MQIQFGSITTLIACLLFVFKGYGQDNKVEVVEKNGTWSLLVNGEDFYIKGAGGDDQWQS